MTAAAKKKKKFLAQKVTLAHPGISRSSLACPPWQPQAYKRLKLPLGSTVFLGELAFIGKGVDFTHIRRQSVPLATLTVLTRVSCLQGELCFQHLLQGSPRPAGVAPDILQQCD